MALCEARLNFEPARIMFHAIEIAVDLLVIALPTQ